MDSASHSLWSLAIDTVTWLQWVAKQLSGHIDDPRAGDQAGIQQAPLPCAEGEHSGREVSPILGRSPVVGLGVTIKVMFIFLLGNRVLTGLGDSTHSPWQPLFGTA